MTEQRDVDEGRKPVPDPTVLTTQALLREVASLKELLQSQDYGQRREVAELKELLQSQILGIDRRITEKFDGLERRRLEQKKDTEDAVEAALTAQKEAVTKSEIATGKQIEQLQTTLNVAVGDLRRTIDDVKERVTEVASIATSTVQQRVGARDDRTGLYASLGALGGLIFLAIAVAAVLAQRSP